MLTLVFLIVALLVFTQFGGRLAASQALTWWITFVFLGVATAFPAALRPVASFVGVELVSNLVLAGMIMLLVLQLIEQSANTTVIGRKLRAAVAAQAADQFIGTRSQDKDSTTTPNKRSVLVVLPCYNEEDAIPKVVDRMQRSIASASSPVALDFVFVNDGSADGTLNTLRRLVPNNYASHSVNVGVSGVLLTGFRIAKSMGFDYVIQCDGDGQHPIEVVGDLANYAASAKVDILIGSRRCAEPLKTGMAIEKDESTTFLRYLGSQILKLTMSMFGRSVAVSDPTSGFRVFSQRAMELLIKNMPDEYPEPEAVAIAHLKGLSVREVRVKMSPRETGNSSLSGIKSLKFMVKVSSALLGLRLRTLIRL